MQAEDGRPADLQAQNDETTPRGNGLRNQIGQLATALAETEARLAELTTIRKVFAELTPAGAKTNRPRRALLNRSS
ncbi:hypothetical protein GCM10010361_47300 [Streptomyces olivaceiscleroticus]|uniref:Transposase n=1 Tax=Streptomyces olivaceiscleroticus TaxID=68245 RepID=A0ABN1AIH7_9ACTN